MNCEQARQTLLDSLDGPVTAELRLSMDNHFSTCAVCRGFAEVQRAIDARLTAALPAASLSSGFRRSLQQKLQEPVARSWPESLPDIAHVTGCAVGIVVLLLVLPQYSRSVVLGGAGFTAVTYFLQAVLRSSFEAGDDRL
jgi:predicted anti-sigma-YlaC factor YlaD